MAAESDCAGGSRARGRNAFPDPLRGEKAVDHLCRFRIEDGSPPFLPPFHYFFISSWGKFKNVFSFFFGNIVQRKKRFGRPHCPDFISQVSESPTLFSLASSSAGIYSKALLNRFPFSEYLF